MTILKGIEVAVQVDGNDLVEHDASSSNDDGFRNLDPALSRDNITKYVEATSGTTFQIKALVPVSFDMSSEVLSFEVELDQIPVGGWLCLSTAKDDEDGHWEELFRGTSYRKGRRWRERPFTFAEIVIGEPRSGPLEDLLKGCLDKEPDSMDKGSNSDRTSKLGSIVVKVYREALIPKSRAGQRPKKICLNEDQRFTEKELKNTNVSHKAKLGPERADSNIKFKKTEYIDWNDEDLVPFATFTFRYCFRRILQGLLLIPRTPTPPPLEERDIETLMPEDLRELARRQQANFRAQRTAEVKVEVGTRTAGAYKRDRDEEYNAIVASATAKKAKTRPFMQGEVVDLCDD